MKRRSFYLTMHDGIKIAVDLCLPDRVEPGARMPAILHQTRYWRAIDFRWPIGLIVGLNMYDMLKIRPAFVDRGYAWISVDVRGSGASCGSQIGPYPPESVEDVREIADWIVAQPWSNGKIGVYGISYDGFTAISALRARHPAILACAPTYTVFDLFPDIAGIGGVPFSWFHRTWGMGTKALDANQIGFFTGLLPKLVGRGVRPVDSDRSRSLLADAIRDHERNWDVYETSFRMTCRDDSLPYDPEWSLDRFSPHSYLEEIAGPAPLFCLQRLADALPTRRDPLLPERPELRQSLDHRPLGSRRPIQRQPDSA
jgi:putative CocE/NonD family hydrolase